MDDVGTIQRAPREPVLNARDLAWLLEQYLDKCRTKVDAKTASTYACRLRIVVEWWLDVGPARRWLLKASDLDALEYYLRGRPSSNSGKPLSYTYRRGILQSLREAFRWAYANGYMKSDCSSWVPAANGAKTKRRAANENELLKLLVECDNSPRRVRDRAIISVFVGMGLRCAEVSNLNVEHIHFEEDYSGHANVRGKRTKANPDGTRDAAFESATGVLLAEHIATLGYERGPLFVSYRGKRVESYTLYGIVKKLIKRAGLENHIQACHDLRRAFTTYYARNRKGSDSADLRRRQLGHTSYSQTTEYTFYEVDDIRHDIVSPVSLLAERKQSASNYL